MTAAAAKAADLAAQVFVLFAAFAGVLLVGEITYLLICRAVGEAPAPGGCWGP